MKLDYRPFTSVAEFYRFVLCLAVENQFNGLRPGFIIPTDVGVDVALNNFISSSQPLPRRLKLDPSSSSSHSCESRFVSNRAISKVTITCSRLLTLFLTVEKLKQKQFYCGTKSDFFHVVEMSAEKKIAKMRLNGPVEAK